MRGRLSLLLQLMLLPAPSARVGCVCAGVGVSACRGTGTSAPAVVVTLVGGRSRGAVLGGKAGGARSASRASHSRLVVRGQIAIRPARLRAGRAVRVARNLPTRVDHKPPSGLRCFTPLRCCFVDQVFGAGIVHGLARVQGDAQKRHRREEQVGVAQLTCVVVVGGGVVSSRTSARGVCGWWSRSRRWWRRRWSRKIRWTRQRNPTRSAFKRSSRRFSLLVEVVLECCHSF